MPKGGLPFDLSITDPKARVQNFIDKYLNDSNYDGFEALLMRNIKVVSARRAKIAQEGMESHCVFELEVLPGLCNPMGNMHGGAMALLADMTTTMTTAPISEEGWWEFSGVSRTLNVTFLNGAPQGTILSIDCMLRNSGKRLSIHHCTVKDRDSGKLLALAEHGKSALAPQEKKSGGKSQL